MPRCPFWLAWGSAFLCLGASGCVKAAARVWVPTISVSSSNASLTAPVSLEGWTQLRYTIQQSQDKTVVIFLSDKGQTGTLPRVLTISTNSTALTGSVEQDVPAGHYAIFTSASGTWSVEVLKEKK